LGFASKVSRFAPAGHVFARVTARDADIGNNARLSYSIIAGNQAEAFEVDPLTGAIAVSQKLQEVLVLILYASCYFLLNLIALAI